VIVVNIPEPLVDEIIEALSHEFIKKGSALYQLCFALQHEREWQKKQMSDVPGQRLSLAEEQSNSADKTSD
jgi:hypothetical protein